MYRGFLTPYDGEVKPQASRRHDIEEKGLRFVPFRVRAVIAS
jgi:hypothetical protein